jgi:ribA/ribD-fused uncharacterized protein
MESFTFFWRQTERFGAFSQWFRSKFVIDGIEYNCAEQYMMAQKAQLFGDDERLKLIMLSEDPREQKALGKQVKGFDETKWNACAKSVVYRGNHAKFTQNPDLKEVLLGTMGTTLVEASRYDQIWGIGLEETDARAQKRDQWRGTNWLGEVLTQLREDLLNEEVG